MAKISKAMSFKNVTISLEDMKLTEYNKDDFEEFNLMDILREWDGIDGVSISIKKDSDLSAIDSDGKDDDQ